MYSSCSAFMHSFSCYYWLISSLVVWCSIRALPHSITEHATVLIRGRAWSNASCEHSGRLSTSQPIQHFCVLGIMPGNTKKRSYLLYDGSNTAPYNPAQHSSAATAKLNTRHTPVIQRSTTHVPHHYYLGYVMKRPAHTSPGVYMASSTLSARTSVAVFPS